MERPVKGSIKKLDKNRWQVRITFTDEQGKKHDKKVLSESYSEANEILKRLVNELDYGGQAIIKDRMTFEDLAKFYSEKYLIPAKYVDGRKVAGLRSVVHTKAFLPPLIEYFGNKRIKEITHTDILTYKLKRLDTPKQTGAKRSIAGVNRELELLRRMLNIAHQEGWILRSPFSIGKSLISKADERKCERILTREEETRLLNACVGRRTHLKPIIICALDTGMRQGEILSLRWRNIDFDEKVITVEAFNTKTMQTRQVAMTTRLERELWSLYQSSNGDKNTLVFGITDNVKRSFDGARKEVGLADVRFHDLRHTAATRLVSKHIPISEVGRVLGHSQPSTTYRYVNANLETVRRAASALDEFQRQSEGTKLVEEHIN
jgi:integrase